MNEENRKIDKKPFEDNLSIKGEHKKSLKGEGRSSYSRITDKHVYDVHGEKVASFDNWKKGKNPETGKSSKVYTYKAKDGKTIELAGNTIFVNGKNVGSIKQKNKKKEVVIKLIILLLLLLCLIFLIIQAYSFPATHKIDVRDENGSWSGETKINMLGSSIKPGSEGEYDFYVENQGTADLTCTFTMSQDYNYKPIDKFPMTFRLKDSNGYLDEEWKYALDVRVENILLEAGEQIQLTIEWQWTFEGGQDELDTYFGNQGGLYSVHLYLTSEQNSV